MAAAANRRLVPNNRLPAVNRFLTGDNVASAPALPPPIEDDVDDNDDVNETVDAFDVDDDADFCLCNKGPK